MSINFIINKEVADVLIEHLNLTYLEYYPNWNNVEHYFEFANNHCSSFFKESWCKGGTSGSCWSDELTEVGEENEPDLEHLREFLLQKFPKLNEDNIYDIMNSFEYDSSYDSDYYGGSIDYGTKSMPFSVIGEHVSTALYSESNDIVNFETLVEEFSQLIINLDLHSYKKYKLYNQFDENIPSNQIENMSTKQKI
jgi:hypothetical protein